MISKLEAWDADVVVQNHALRENLKDATSRAASVKVALACLKAEFAKSTFETASVYSWVWNIVKVKVLRKQGEQIGVSNLRELGLSISEHSRNIVGICASPFMSPQSAASTFLTQGPRSFSPIPKRIQRAGLAHRHSRSGRLRRHQVKHPFESMFRNCIGHVPLRRIHPGRR